MFPPTIVIRVLRRVELVLYSQFTHYLCLPIKKIARVPGPAWEPITGPISVINVTSAPWRCIRISAKNSVRFT